MWKFGREENLYIDELLEMQEREYMERFCSGGGGTYAVAEAMLWWDKLKAREVADAVVGLTLARFAARELGEEQTKRFEGDDDKDSYIRAYLNSAVRHAVIDLFRNEKAERRRRRVVADRTSTSERLSDPMKAACRQELCDRVRATVAELPESDGRVLHLYYFQSKSCGEIAAELGVAKGTIQYRLHQARRSLASRLSQFVEEPE